MRRDEPPFERLFKAREWGVGTIQDGDFAANCSLRNQSLDISRRSFNFIAISLNDQQRYRLAFVATEYSVLPLRI